MAGLIAGAIGTLSGPVFDLIDKLYETEEERSAARLKLLTAEMQPVLAQLAVNAKEAEHDNVFVAGWRPFIGWACGAIFVFNFIAAPLLHWGLLLGGATEIPIIPTLGVGEIMPVLLGLLGLGSLRSYEKVQGADRRKPSG